MDFGRKRGRTDTAFAGNGSFKKSKDEMDSFTTGVGRKSMPCTKFFSTSGCSFGDSCHFQHHFPGYSAQVQMAKLGRNSAVPFTDGPTRTLKSKLCSNINTPEGCRFGEKCRFAHSEMELGKPVVPGHEDSRAMGSTRSLPAANFGSSSTNFGSSATAKISIDASFAGTIIGKNGVNSRQICRQTGVKLSIKDHETDPNQRNIELEGSFDQIKEASTMVRELIMNISAFTGRAEKPMGPPFGQGMPPNNFKKKPCENFAKGLCNFGERCHFAHSASELRRPFV
ncbi:Zinc finger CCCH domain-containing protein 52 [Forsythia ovata]|uniref:Zinc finger CCCH domain-containing protein 52 n=1 Tax=Forsythia ovata TaxID=205694 RepID=A0ABD1TNY8_9LAMI